MDICIARQPVFDNKMQVYGYALLYEQNSNPHLTEQAEGPSGAELLYDSFFIIGIDDLTNGTNALIHFSKDLLETDIPISLPKQRIVVEVLEHDYSSAVSMEDCKKIKEKGFLLSLDGFILDDVNLSLLEISDLIKIDFTAATIETQAALIRKYKDKVTFFADHIDTREDYKRAVEIGYSLFQGDFFSKPSFVNSKEIETLDMNLFNLVQELDSEEPNFSVISDIIEHDLGLSYKLLKFVNSAYIASWYKINSIPRATSYLGTRRLRQFLLLMMVKNLSNPENTELIRLSLVRGKLMSLIVQELGMKEAGSEYFFTGLFSMIDVLLNREMEDILKELPLINQVKQALLGEPNDLKRMLDFVVCYEKAQWDQIDGRYPMDELGKGKLSSLYLDALKWANLLD